MMIKKWYFHIIFDQFLTYTTSCTFAVLNNEEILQELEKFLMRAIGEFKFPQVSLDFTFDEEAKEYYFIDENFSFKEINVLIAYMKKYFHEFLYSKEENFQQLYYDSDTKTFSQANMAKQLLEAYKVASNAAEETNRNYLKMDRKYKSRIGSVNE